VTGIVPLLSIVAIVLSSITLFVVLRARIAVDLTPLLARLDALDRQSERSERSIRDQLTRNRTEATNLAQATREELTTRLEAGRAASSAQLVEQSRAQLEQLHAFSARLDALTTSNQQQLELVRSVLEDRFTKLQCDTAQKLDAMRKTVDEQLQGTLEKRLGESFAQVSIQLEQVYKGLGEMQALATGVGDLKKVLSNVKSRGTWGEVQLGTLLEEVMSPSQYAQNVCTKGEGAERVEFAIRLPGRDANGADQCWLPIDSKFPLEDYTRLVDATEAGDVDAVESAGKQLEARTHSCAKDIFEKYIAPPFTTDFGIMFLPTEGLYAEVLRRPGLAESLRIRYHVTIVGPTTLWAVLNSFQMGFRTLAIQKRSSEVWEVLGAAKTEFHRYGDVLDRVKEKLLQASTAVDRATVRTRAIERKLRDVEEIAPAAGDAMSTLTVGSNMPLPSILADSNHLPLP
jgi:DNA recombination protein RmuC